VRASWFIVVLSVFCVIAWLGRDAVLTTAGQWLIVQDPLERADLIMVSSASLLAGAFEASRLYREGLGGTIVMTGQYPQPHGDDIRALGIPFLEPTEVATAILERTGVPRTAIVALSDPADGTDEEIEVIADYVRTHHVEHLMYITSQTHSARARWLLQRHLPPATHCAVRSPRNDPYDAASWYRTRDSAREVAVEYLRWLNTAILRDPWGR
jgi:uncharacterized SAM-binding protein YcdF (DUF218 family)